jgi:hypothetical protein
VPSDQPGATLVIRQRRSKLAVLGLLGVGFVALGIWFIVDPTSAGASRYPAGAVEALGWISTLFFGFALAAVVFSFFRPTTISLSPEGLAIKTVFTAWTRPWKALSNFRIWRYRGNRLIVFDDDSPRRPRLAKFNTAISGATSGLPNMLSEDPEQVLAQLIAAKERWG